MNFHHIFGLTSLPLCVCLQLLKKTHFFLDANHPFVINSVPNSSPDQRFGFGLSLTHFHLTLASPVKSLTLDNQSSSQTLKLVISTLTGRDLFNADD